MIFYVWSFKMKKLKKKSTKEIEKIANDFYNKYNILPSQDKNIFIKENGNFKYVWEFKSASNEKDNTTSIY